MPSSVSANLAARYFPEKSDAHFVGNALFGQLLLGFADEGNFRNGVNAIGIVGAIGMDGNAESVGRRNAALLHGNGAKAGKADNIPDGENVWLLGAVIVVDGNASARVGLQPGGGKIQFVDVALPPHRIEKRVARNFFLALEHCGHTIVRSFFYAFDLFVQAHGDTAISQVVTES